MTATRTTAARATTTTVRTAMFRPAARILVGRMLSGRVPRHVRALFDLELRRLDEIDLALQQLLDIAQVAELIR